MGMPIPLVDRVPLVRCVVLSLALYGCGSGDETSVSPSSTHDGAVPLDGSDFNASELAVDSSTRPDAPPIVPAGNESACDGRDDDGNGVIDDVDVEQDGVCDCLSIATLGGDPPSSTSSVFKGWLSKRSRSGAAALGTAELTDAALAKYQIIVTQDLTQLGRSYKPQEIDALQRWVEAGGGLLTLTGYSANEVANVNSVLSRFDLAYGEQGILLNWLIFFPLPVSDWTPHPISEGVQTVGMNNGYPVLGSGTSIARKDGYDLMKVKEVGKGRVIVWADEWITFDSQWSSQPDFQVERLWLNMLKWLSPPNQCQVPVVIN